MKPGLGFMCHTRNEEMLHNPALCRWKALMKVPHPVRQGLLQCSIREILHEWSQILLSWVKEPARTKRRLDIRFPMGLRTKADQIRVYLMSACNIVLPAPLWHHVSSTEGEDINSGETSLASWWHKHQHWLGWGVFHYGVIHRFCHGQQTSLCVTHVEALRKGESSQED